MKRPSAVLPYTKSFTAQQAVMQFPNVSWVAVLFGSFMFSAIFIPYIIATIGGTVNPVLPFISQAAGSPPQSGVFSVLLSLSATVGFFGLNTLHLGICVYQEKVPKDKERLLQFLNKVSLIPGNLAILGMLIVGGFPVDTHRNNEDWVLVTIAPHLTGAIILFGGGVAYGSMLTLIMVIIFPEKKRLLGIRIFLLTVTILSALIHAITVREAFALEYYDEDRLTSCSLKIFEYDTSYLICSICEWVMAVTFICSFTTMYHEGKLFSLTLSVELLENNSRSPKLSGLSEHSHVSKTSSATSTECILEKSEENRDEQTTGES